LFSLLVVAGGAIVVNTLEYRLSWDIVKFAAVTYIILGLMASVWLFSPERKLIVRYLGTAALLVDSVNWVFSATYHVIPGLPHGQKVGSLSTEEEALWRSDLWKKTSADDRAAISWLRSRVGQNDLVARDRPASRAYAILGGLPEASFDIDGSKPYYLAFGVSKELADRHLHLTADPPGDAGAFRKEGIRWVVADTDSASRDTLLQPALLWVQRGQADIAAKFGAILVIHLR
jgi:hypothetical protein